MSKNFKVKNGLETTNITASADISGSDSSFNSSTINSATIAQLNMKPFSDIVASQPGQNQGTILSSDGDGFRLGGDVMQFYQGSQPIVLYQGTGAEGIGLLTYNGGDSILGNYGGLKRFTYSIKGGKASKHAEPRTSFSQSFGTNDNDIVRIDNTYFQGANVLANDDAGGISIVATGSTLPNSQSNGTRANAIHFVKTGSNTQEFLHNVSEKVNELDGDTFGSLNLRTFGVTTRTGSFNVTGQIIHAVSVFEDSVIQLRQITGSGTSFTSELNAGDLLKITSESTSAGFLIDSIQSDTKLILGTQTTNSPFFNPVGAQGLSGSTMISEGNNFQITSSNAGNIGMRFQTGSSSTKVLDTSDYKTFSNNPAKGFSNTGGTSEQVFKIDTDTEGNGSGVSLLDVNCSINNFNNITNFIGNITASGNISMSGGVFTGDGSGMTGVVASAGGADTQVQFNDGGSNLGGDSGLTYNKTTDTLSAVKLSLTNITSSGNISGSHTGSFGKLKTDDLIEAKRMFVSRGGTFNTDNSELGSFTIRGETDNNLFSANPFDFQDKIGIGTASPQSLLHVAGNITCSTLNLATGMVMKQPDVVTNVTAILVRDASNAGLLRQRELSSLLTDTSIEEIGHTTLDVLTAVNITASNNIKLQGNISGSVTSTGSFGSLMIDGGHFTSASLAAGGSGVSSYDDLTNVPSGIFSSSLQTFTNITASGNISASGDIKADRFTVENIISLGATGVGGSNPELRLGNQTDWKTIRIANADTTNGTIISSHITASGNISSSGDIFVEDATIQDLLSVGRIRTSGVDGQITLQGSLDSITNITASGNISSSGNLFVNKLFTSGTIDLTSNNTSIRGTETGGTARNMLRMTDDDDIVFGNSTSPNRFLANITASGNISASGTITMLTASIGGGIFTSASLAAGGGGGGSGTITALNNQIENRLVTIGSTTTELDGEANITYDGTTFTVNDDMQVGDGNDRLTVGGDISASAGIHLDSDRFIYFKTNDTSDNRIRYSNSQDLISIKSDQIYLDADNGVGIGVFNPATTLQVSGDISSSGFISTESHITASGNISSSGTIISNEINTIGHITASGNISASGGNHTLGGLQIIESSDSGSIAVSGSIKIQDQELLPEVSESRIFNSGSNLFFGKHAGTSPYSLGPKVLQTYSHNFVDDPHTTEHALPWPDSFENAGQSDESVAFLCTSQTNVRHVLMRGQGFDQNLGGTITWRIKTHSPYGNSVLTEANWTTKETTTVTIPSSVDTGGFNLIYVCFSGSHAQPGDLLNITFQFSADFAASFEEFYVSSTVEHDYCTLPNLGFSTGSIPTGSAGFGVPG